MLLLQIGTQGYVLAIQLKMALNNVEYYASKYRVRDEEAREEVAAQPVVNVTRPTVLLQHLKNFISGKFHFQVNPPAENEVQRHYTHFRAGANVSNNLDISNFVKTVEKFRIMSVDTEGKKGRIFLILGNFLGDVLLFNNACDIPRELRQLLSDVNVYKIQSNVVEDVKILSEVCNIRVVGIADTQVAHGVFNLGSEEGNVGTVAQARFVGVDPRPYNYHMDFQRGNKLPGDKELLHALSDARQPFLTIFKAVVTHVSHFHVGLTPEDNFFDFVWDLLNKIAGVSTQVVLENSLPRRRTTEENWKVSRSASNSFMEDINNSVKYQAIKLSQKGWLPTPYHRPQAVRKLFLRDDYRIAKNKRRSQNYKLKRAADPEKYCKKSKKS